MSTAPRVLYNTPDPLKSPSELYKVSAEVLEAATDAAKCWIVVEEHGYWDEAKKEFLVQQPTLKPTDPRHCVSLEDAYKGVEAQIMLRAREGFRYLFEWYPFVPPFFRKFEIQPNGTKKEY
jgi:hypothetical protein